MFVERLLTDHRARSCSIIPAPPAMRESLSVRQPQSRHCCVSTFRSAGVVWLVLAVLTLGIGGVFAQSEPEETAADPDAPPSLSATQEAIEMRYRRFEITLEQLSDYLRKTDATRSELLLRAIGKSKEGRITDQFKSLTELLKKDQLGDAVERQEMVVAELQSLLELLMSEARKDDLEQEKKRIQELIKDVTKLIGKETDARANTERGANAAELQNQQKQVSDETKKLAEKIKSQDAAKKGADSSTEKDAGKNADKSGGKSGDDQSEKKESDSQDGGESDNADKPDSGDDSQEGKQPSPDQKGKSSQKGQKSSDANGERKPADAEKPAGDEDAKPEEGEKGSTEDEGAPKSDDPEQSKDAQEKSQNGKQGKPQPGKKPSGKPQKGKPQQGKPQEGEPQEGQEQQEQQEGQEQQSDSQEQESSPQKQPQKTAGRDEIERARQEMDRAIEELKRNNRKGASDKQDQAIAELMKAKEKLEEILRQLREEEREMVLAQLEARFRDMLQKQEAVNNATLAIHAVPVDNRTDRHRNRSVELARNEEEISLLAAKALTLLKEEGSSVAFPEAVEQIRDDMLTVARRLERVDVAEITQNIEEDIVEGLREIIEALQKEIEKAKDKKQEQQQQQQQPQDRQKELVNKLAELKMLRSLQYRVNRRTKLLGRMVDGEQALDGDILNQLRQLSDRQSKVQRATYDLSTGRTE